ncbi:MAG TPA: RNA polymerase sigma factor [Polyangiaceae bacterium]|nr:RNA polymerase sigma factor [Polyangiaceae bacterium]
MAAAPDTPGLGVVAPRPEEIDAATLEACRKRDRASLQRFVLTYQRTVFAFLSRMLGHGPHVEDVAQEVFVKACGGLPRFDPSGPARVSTWLLGIASHAAIDHRRRNRRKLVSLEEVAPGVDARTPELEQQRRELLGAFERAASRLDDDQRAVFVLAEFHELGMAEIARTLGVPENTVKTRLFRARERMRAMLEGVREE